MTYGLRMERNGHKNSRPQKFSKISLSVSLSSSFSHQTWILLQDAVDQGDFEHVSEVARMGEVRGGRGANAASRMRNPEIGCMFAAIIMK